MKTYEIPLRPHAERFTIALGGIEYTLHLRWNQFHFAWVMDIHDDADTPILRGVPLVTGTDLLGQYRYLGIGGGIPMIVLTIGPGRSPDELPSYQGLGTDSHLYVMTL